MDVAAFWSPWEVTVDSFESAEEQIYGVFEKRSKRGSVFAWRGQLDAAWPLHSSLYRRLLWSSDPAEAPKESDVAEAERTILADVRRWGLHMGGYGRLSVLNQLAMLQHYGAPTRLVDITFNPWIGLWFAVQERSLDEDDTPRDVRLFAFDVTDRLINERGQEFRWWEDALEIPWPKPVAPTAGADEREAYRQWITNTYAWRPSRFHPRLAAQNGGFLLGGVPSTGAMVWPKTPDPADGRWSIDEVRRATSVAMRVQKLGTDTADENHPDAMYTIRIVAEAVPAIRRRLQDLFGYEALSMYPDYTGFAEFGTPWLRRTPPPAASRGGEAS